MTLAEHVRTATPPTTEELRDKLVQDMWIHWLKADTLDCVTPRPKSERWEDRCEGFRQIDSLRGDPENIAYVVEIVMRARYR